MNSGAGFVNPANHLVTGRHRQGRRRGSPLDLIQFGMTDSARGDLDPHFPRPRFGEGALPQTQRLPLGVQINQLF